MGLEQSNSANDDSFDDIRIALSAHVESNKTHSYLLDYLKDNEWLKMQTMTAQANATREGLFELRKQLDLLSSELPTLAPCKGAVHQKLIALAYRYPLNEHSPRGFIACPISNCLVANLKTDDITLSNGYIYSYEGLMSALRESKPLGSLENISDYDITLMREKSIAYSKDSLLEALSSGLFVSVGAFLLIYFIFMMAVLAVHAPLLLGVGASIAIIIGASLALGFVCSLVFGVRSYLENIEEEPIVESHLLNFFNNQSVVTLNNGLGSTTKPEETTLSESTSSSKSMGFWQPANEQLVVLEENLSHTPQGR